MEKEKRHYIRLTIPVSFTLTHPERGSLQFETIDLSDGGVFLKAAPEQCPAIGDEITLQVVGSLGGQPPPVVPARVVRVTDKGMGIQFL